LPPGIGQGTGVCCQGTSVVCRVSGGFALPGNPSSSCRRAGVRVFPGSRLRSAFTRAWWSACSP